MVNTQKILSNLPSVDSVLSLLQKETNIPKFLIVLSAREVLSEKREEILNKKEFLEKIDRAKVMEEIKKRALKKSDLKLKKVINATGIVIHTNLGRSILEEEVLKNIVQVGGSYSNLEFDIEKKKRGKRNEVIESVVCDISGAESAFVVNNNAAAVLLVLDTFAKGKEVIISRGELVEIGGSFRIPDIMQKSGSYLIEVGTTNRTHLKDYEKALSDNTSCFLKVHKSNYFVGGFTKEVSLKEIVALGKKYKKLVIEDLGSGTFIDFSKYGILKEPTVQESVKAGADIITFSGDKLLGGPQAGIIVGKKKYINLIKENPLARAVRIDKLTLSALETTLKLYYEEEEAIKRIPTLKMITMPIEEINRKANKFLNCLKKNKSKTIESKKIKLTSYIGGGAFPTLSLESVCVALKIKNFSTSELDFKMRSFKVPVIGRIENDFFIIDFRCVKDEEIKVVSDYILNIDLCT